MNIIFSNNYTFLVDLFLAFIAPLNVTSFYKNFLKFAWSFEKEVRSKIKTLSNNMAQLLPQWSREYCRNYGRGNVCFLRPLETGGAPLAYEGVEHMVSARKV